MTPVTRAGTGAPGDDRLAPVGETTAGGTLEAIRAVDAPSRHEAVEQFLAVEPAPVEDDWAAMKRADRAALYDDT